jgi:hypothetical protein
VQWRVKATNLIRSNAMTQSVTVASVVEAIDAAFGEGFAREHPDLVGRMLLASAVSLAGIHITNGLTEIASALEDTEVPLTIARPPAFDVIR